jgi:hypothetical protein
MDLEHEYGFGIADLGMSVIVRSGVCAEPELELNGYTVSQAGLYFLSCLKKAGKPKPVTTCKDSLTIVSFCPLEEPEFVV